MAQKQKLIEEKLAVILEEENRKHVTHVGFAIIAIYKDGRSVAKTGVRPGFEAELSEAIAQFETKLHLEAYKNHY